MGKYCTASELNWRDAPIECDDAFAFTVHACTYEGLSIMKGLRNSLGLMLTSSGNDFEVQYIA